jgi:hypothetical protein
MTRALLTAFALASVAFGSADAQGGRAGNRQNLERQVKQTLARRVAQELGLNAEQMASLSRVDAKYNEQRRLLNRDDADVRRLLRSAMLDSANVDQTKVAQHIDRMLQLQRRRVDILEAEQKELGTFLTPMQRAQYMALQERVRRAIEQRLGPGRGRPGAPPQD